MGWTYTTVSLPTVTLVAVSSVRIRRTVRALKKSMRGIRFGQVILVSHEKPKRLPVNISFFPCRRISSIDEYSRFILFELWRFVSTDFALVTQHDGYVARPEKWKPVFLDFDYVGAPWPKNLHHTQDGETVEVGNGGFSLRSKKLLTSFTRFGLSFSDSGTGFFNEDGQICVYNRSELESHGILFASPGLAQEFSMESAQKDGDVKPFGFHGNSTFLPLPERLRYEFLLNLDRCVRFARKHFGGQVLWP